MMMEAVVVDSHENGQSSPPLLSAGVEDGADGVDDVVFVLHSCCSSLVEPSSLHRGHGRLTQETAV